MSHQQQNAQAGAKQGAVSSAADAQAGSRDQPAASDSWTWNRSPTGLVAMIGGRRCEIVRAPSPPGAPLTLRVTVAGIVSSELRNGGTARDYQEAKSIARDALIAAGVIQGPSARSGGGARYAPHPIEIRMRAVDAATAVLNTLGLKPTENVDDLGQRLRQVKQLALGLEAFIKEAGQQAQGQHVEPGTDVRAL